MKLRPLMVMALGLPLRTSAILSSSNISSGQEPLVRCLDHIPVVVTDLERGQANFRAMGFAIKPGRFYADGIQNAHVKFPDGTEIERITASKATDKTYFRIPHEDGKGRRSCLFWLVRAQPRRCLSKV